MKKLLMVIFALFCVNCVMAQEEWTEEKWDGDGALFSKRNREPKKETPSVAFADKQTGIIQITVPKNLRIADKIFVENNSTRTIVQMAIMADYNANDQYVSVASVSAIPVGATKVAAESDGDYRSLRGKALKMKIKGCRTNNSDDVSYDFNVTLYEKDHDLYIKVGSNDAFDF